MTVLYDKLLFTIIYFRHKRPNLTSNSTLTFEFQIILSQDLSSVPVEAMKVSDGKLLIYCDEKKKLTKYAAKNCHQQIFFCTFKKEVLQE